MSDEQEIKPTPKFGTVKEQRETVKEEWRTLGHKKEEPDMQGTLTSKRQNTITSKKQDVPEMKRQTVYMPTTLADWLKAHAALIHDDISGIITRLVEDYKNEAEEKSR